MNPKGDRSQGVTTASTATLPAATARALDFDALYRDARDDVFAYTATLLRDRAAAEDVTAQAFERAYISTFVICTGDSDFTPLVHKLRELNKRVIGVGVEKSTSALLPPALLRSRPYRCARG